MPAFGEFEIHRQAFNRALPLPCVGYESRKRLTPMVLLQLETVLRSVACVPTKGYVYVMVCATT